MEAGALSPLPTPWEPAQHPLDVPAKPRLGDRMGSHRICNEEMTGNKRWAGPSH